MQPVRSDALRHVAASARRTPRALKRSRLRDERQRYLLDVPDRGRVRRPSPVVSDRPTDRCSIPSPRCCCLPWSFFVIFRLPFEAPRSWARERWSVQGTHLALPLMFAARGIGLGFRGVLLVQLSTSIVASIIGLAPFSLQHRFEHALRTLHDKWARATASLQGSFYLHRQHRLSSRSPSRPEGAALLISVSHQSRCERSSHPEILSPILAASGDLAAIPTDALRQEGL